jgi:prepilin-type N-terminal cleavage/methylation domain-containing protein
MCRNIQLRIVRHGFTMIELMVVLAIIAIAAAIVVPMTSSTGSMQLRAAVTMVAADLEYAKSMSISRGHRYAVVFDKSEGVEGYQIEDLSKPVGDPDRIVEHPVRKGSKYLVRFAADNRLSQVDIVDANFDTTNTVSFDYLGSPVNGSNASLNSGEITLRAGGLTRRVIVQPVTGYISISNN